jgi:RNA polymerase sigma factor (sigma-70 family)
MTRDPDDFSVKITVRNGRLLRAILENYQSVSELARKLSVSSNCIYKLVGMRTKPVNSKGWTKLAEDVALMVGKDPIDLWPEHLREIKLQRSSSEMDLSLEQVQQLVAEGSHDNLLSQNKAIKDMIGNLNEREKTVISLRYHDGKTLSEIGSYLNLSNERVRQIEARATTKMKASAVFQGYMGKEEKNSWRGFDYKLKAKAIELLSE